MIDFTKYNLDNDDLEFLDRLKGDLECLNENLLEYNGIAERDSVELRQKRLF